MKRMLFNATYAEELRVASVDGKKLLNFDIETSSKEQRRGNIYKGLVTRVEPSLEACFVDYGNDKQGFLPFKEIDYRYLPEINGQKTRDFSKLPLGTEMIVQVEKDERGNKGAALTTYATLPGRYLVLMPNNSRSGGISRRIEGEERDELKSLMSQLNIPSGMSIILRTAALGRAVEELAWDLNYLTRLWEMIVTAGQERGAFLIYLESSLVIRSIRDHFSPDITEILIDTEEVYHQARSFMSLVMPNFADRVKHYTDDVPLFSRFQIEHQIESAYSRMVTLPSGGVIVIDQTEALTAVDVNSAKANKGADIETTAFLTNLEAAEEVARQLRLRDLGGLVVVDFIDMENPRNQRDLENHFSEQLSIDRARIQMGKLSKFGLLELSRQRLQPSLEESMTITCPRCSGVGAIRGIESNALHILRLVQEDVVRNSGQLSAIQVQLPVDIATYLLNERRDDVASIEARVKVKIVLIPNVHLNSPHYKVKKLSHGMYDNNFGKSSYNLVEAPEEVLGYNAVTKKTDNPNKIPAVQQVANLAPAPVIEKKNKSVLAGFVKAIGSWFAPAEPVELEPKPRNLQNKNKSKKDFSSADRSTSPRAQRNKDDNREKIQPSTNASKVVANERTKEVPIQDKVKSVEVKKSTESVADMGNKVKIPRSRAKLAKENTTGELVRSRDNKTTNPANRIDNSDKNVSVNNVALPTIPAVAKVEQSSANVQNITAKLEPAVEASILDKVVTEVKVSPLVASKLRFAENAAIIDDVAIEVPSVYVEPEPADLGGMELVATNASLVINCIEPILEDVNRKRYNDIERVQPSINNDNQFELVETKS